MASNSLKTIGFSGLPTRERLPRCERFDGDRANLREQVEDALLDGDEDKVEVAKKALVDLELRIGSLGNLAFLLPSTNQQISNRPPHEYLAEIASTPEGRTALEAQLIPLEPSLWRHSAFSDFLRARCELIAAKARQEFLTI